MNTRICSFIAVVTIVSLSSGCSGMRNFLFGRGARCGLCNSSSNPMPAPAYGAPAQAPCGQAQSGPAPCAQPAPTCPTQGCFGNMMGAPADGCGCNSYAGNVYDSQVYAGRPCGTCGTAGDCGCGGVVDSYAPVINDPYMQGGVISGTVDGQIVGEQIIGGQPYPSTTAPVQADNFSARKFDSDGNRILWEEPLPSGGASL